MNLSEARADATRRSAIQPFLYLVLGFLLAYPLSRGLDFYRLALDARIEHDDFRVLSPGGMVGHGYGIVGTALILTNLLYLVRRRFAWLSAGSLQTWLDIHVVTGIGGSILVAYHSAFQLRTPIATMTALSLGVVVGTGLVGRYLYELAPRTGDASVMDRLRELESIAPSFATAARDALAACATTKLPANASAFRLIATIPRWAVEARRRRRAIRLVARRDPQIMSLRKRERRFTRWLVKDVARLAAAEVDRTAGAAILRLWRSLHRFTAILMVVSVSVHIGVAWFYGYRWIFS